MLAPCAFFFVVHVIGSLIVGLVVLSTYNIISLARASVPTLSGYVAYSVKYCGAGTLAKASVLWVNIQGLWHVLQSGLASLSSWPYLILSFFTLFLW